MFSTLLAVILIVTLVFTVSTAVYLIFLLVCARPRRSNRFSTFRVEEYEYGYPSELNYVDAQHDVDVIPELSSPEEASAKECKQGSGVMATSGSNASLSFYTPLSEPSSGSSQRSRHFTFDEPAQYNEGEEDGTFTRPYFSKQDAQRIHDMRLDPVFDYYTESIPEQTMP